MNDLACTRTFAGTVDEAIEKLGPELGIRGFGVLAKLPVHATLKEKIGANLDELVILDVCSPRHAYAALSTTRAAALALPCKIVVSREEGVTRIALERPTVVLGAVLPLPALEAMGREVERSLCDAVDAVSRTAAPR